MVTPSFSDLFGADLDFKTRSKSSEQPAPRAPSKPSPCERERGRLPSDAALKRRLEALLGPSLFAEDSTWDAIGFLTGFCALLYPLHLQIQQLGRTYRRSATLFWKSVRRVITNRRQTDPMYEANFQTWILWYDRMGAYLQDTNATIPVRKLSKDQKRQHARLVEVVKMFLPLRPGTHPEGKGRDAVKLLTALSKSGRGRKFDPELEKALMGIKTGEFRGYMDAARSLRPNASKETLEDFRDRIADAARYRRRTSS